jgi:hypothetical protein
MAGQDGLDVQKKPGLDVTRILLLRMLGGGFRPQIPRRIYPSQLLRVDGPETRIDLLYAALRSASLRIVKS